jgi:hypothetical protein
VTQFILRVVNPVVRVRQRACDRVLPPESETRGRSKLFKT